LALRVLVLSMLTRIYKLSCVLSFAIGPSSMELLLKDCNIQELK